MNNLKQKLYKLFTEEHWFSYYRDSDGHVYHGNRLFRHFGIRGSLGSMKVNCVFFCDTDVPHNSVDNGLNESIINEEYKK